MTGQSFWIWKYLSNQSITKIVILIQLIRLNRTKFYHYRRILINILYLERKTFHFTFDQFKNQQKFDDATSSKQFTANKMTFLCVFALIFIHSSSSQRTNDLDFAWNLKGDDITSRIKDCFFFEENSAASVELICENGLFYHNGSHQYETIEYFKDNCYATLFEDESKDISRAKVNHLRTGQCRSSEFDGNLAKLFPNLISLDVSHLGLEHSTIEWEFNFKSLHKLIASHNKLQQTDNSMFSSASNLAEIDFSFNKIRSILSTSFDGANSLQSINLSSNVIAYLQSSSFERLSNLRVIDLSGNKLFTFDISMFGNSLGLREIHIQRNQMKRFVYDGNAIPRYESLIVFRAGENKIENVFDELLQSTGPALQVLDLSENYLEILHEWRFYGRHSLRHVNLRRTGFLHFNFSVFENPLELRSLDLSENILMSINFSAFTGHFGNLEALNLRDNSLKHLDGASFEQFPKLATIDISKNKLTCEYARKFVQQWKNLTIVGDPCDQKEMPDRKREIDFLILKMNIILICYFSSVGVSIAFFKRFQKINDKLSNNEDSAKENKTNDFNESIYEEHIYWEIEPQTNTDTYDHLAFRGLTPSTIKNHYDKVIT